MPDWEVKTAGLSKELARKYATRTMNPNNTSWTNDLSHDLQKMVGEGTNRVVPHSEGSDVARWYSELRPDDSIQGMLFKNPGALPTLLREFKKAASARQFFFCIGTCLY